MPGIIVRPYQPADAAACAGVFFDAVQNGTDRRYTAEQRNSWLSEEPTAAEMAGLLEGTATFVAERGAICGFMALRSDGEVHMAYVTPDVQGAGVADALYAMVLNAALCAGIGQLSTKASLLARSFFARHGWQVDRPDDVIRDGITLTRFEMSYPIGEQVA